MPLVDAHDSEGAGEKPQERGGGGQWKGTRDSSIKRVQEAQRPRSERQRKKKPVSTVCT